jgi:hypothetical protein
MVRLLCLAVKMVWVINFCWVSYFRELGSDIMRRDVTDDDTGMIPYWSYKNLGKGKINNERLQIMNMIKSWIWFCVYNFLLKKSISTNK